MLNCYCFRFFAGVDYQNCHVAAIIISRLHEDQPKQLRLWTQVKTQNSSIQIIPVNNSGNETKLIIYSCKRLDANETPNVWNVGLKDFIKKQKVSQLLLWRSSLGHFLYIFSHSTTYRGYISNILYRYKLLTQEAISCANRNLLCLAGYFSCCHKLCIVAYRLFWLTFA